MMSQAKKILDQISDIQSNNLTNNTPLTNDEVVDQIVQLNPFEDTINIMEYIQSENSDFNIDTIPQLSINNEDINNVIRNLSKNSSRGCSGWTFNLLQTLFTTNDNNSNTTTVLSTLFNSMTHNQISSTLWVNSRSCVIPKQQGG